MAGPVSRLPLKVNDLYVPRQKMIGKTGAVRREPFATLHCTWLRTAIGMPVTIVKTTGEYRAFRSSLFHPLVRLNVLDRSSYE